MPKIIADYGYDVHQIEVDQETYEKIRSGEFVSAVGQGFAYDDEGIQADTWCFNEAPGSISIYLENGVEFHATGVDQSAS